MREINGKVEGSLTVGEGVALTGIAAGDIVVSSGGVLELRGVCGGNLKVGEGGVAVIRGTVAGSVWNDGGTVEVYGVIVGTLRDPARTTTIHNGAVIDGVRR